MQKKKEEAYKAWCDFIDILAPAFTHITAIGLDQQRLHTNEIIMFCTVLLAAILICGAIRGSESSQRRCKVFGALTSPFCGQDRLHVPSDDSQTRLHPSSLFVTMSW
jgi:hypothetical protein